MEHERDGVCAQALGALLERGLPLKVSASLASNLSAEGGGGGGAAQAVAQAAAAGALVAAGAQTLAGPLAGAVSGWCLVAWECLGWLLSAGESHIATI